MDSMLLGEQVEELKGDVEQMDRTLDIVAGSSVELATPLKNAHDLFHQAIDAQLKAQKTGGIPAAKRLDQDRTDPAYERYKDEIASIYKKLEAGVLFWIWLVSIATISVLALSAALVAVLILRFRRQVESNVVLELEQEAAQTSERRLKSLMSSSSDVIALIDLSGNVGFVSDACEGAWGRTAEDMKGQPVYAFVDPSDVPGLKAAIDQCASGQTGAHLEAQILCVGAEPRLFDIQAASLLDDTGAGGVVLTFHDLTERKRHENELSYHAFHDRLTKLPNRALFLDRLSHRLKASENGGRDFAVLFIDLDNFKIVNDSLGHEAGDTLLIEVAARLQASVRAADTVARMGGDEFTIILDTSDGTSLAIETAERIQRALVIPVSLGEREVFVTSSIGIVLASQSGSDAASILRDADTAMYHAKGNGKAALAVFEPGMNLEALDRLELESDLRVAIQEEQFSLVYQPIVDIASGRLREVEALIRWNHPERGLVSPNAFIPLAEETGLICAIGKWVLRESFRQVQEWNEGLAPSECVLLSVNVSGRQFQEKEFVQDLRALIAEVGIDPKLVELEVTETAMLSDLSKMRNVFAELREIGFRVAIDDFGTGYSSMAYLSQLPVDKLKIDRSFVIPLGQDDRADGVVQAMITMARTLGLGITGEGIETAEQLRALQEMGCDLGQGFLFDRPLSPEAVGRILTNHVPARMAA
jgi:diguanylate cyclase (GGDEF)-like protein/PAS domain S-box-containing protein